MDNPGRSIIPLPSRSLATRQEGSLLARGASAARELAWRDARVRVIIVEDDPKIRTFLHHGLREEGYDVLGVADDGTTGVELFRNTRPDVVVMNGLMGAMDGIEASRLILSEDARTSVLLQSAWFSPPNGKPLSPNERHRRQLARRAGISACLPVPFTLDHVTDKVDLLAAMPTSAPQEWCWVGPRTLTLPEDPDPSRKDWPREWRACREPDDVPGFLIARVPVTNAQYHLFIKAGGYRQAHLWPEALAAGIGDDAFEARPDLLRMDAVDFSRPDEPVAWVSKFEARAFAHWMEARLLASDELVACGAEIINMRTLLQERGWKVDLPSLAERFSAEVMSIEGSADPGSSPAGTGIATGSFCPDCGVEEWTRSARPLWAPPDRPALIWGVTMLSRDDAIHSRKMLRPAGVGFRRIGYRLAIVPPGRPPPSTLLGTDEGV